uniref:PH domain-containing protein n=1 Tax=Plectus sambesii TaxID=2011161 RepID=A0A914VEM9_9BILA
MYECIDGHQSWSRYWCAISNGSLKFWKHPNEEETEKDPIAIVDLSQCVSERMELASKEECPRLRTLFIDVVHKRESNRLALKRFLLAADSKDDCLEWMRVTNETLRSLRFWPSDSNRI